MKVQKTRLINRPVLSAYHIMEVLRLLIKWELDKGLITVFHVLTQPVSRIEHPASSIFTPSDYSILHTEVA